MVSILALSSNLNVIFAIKYSSKLCFICILLKFSVLTFVDILIIAVRCSPSYKMCHNVTWTGRTFLVACTRLYDPLCPSVGRSVCLSVTLSFFAAPAHPHATSARVYGLVTNWIIFVVITSNITSYIIISYFTFTIWGWYKCKIWQNIFTGLMVFLSGSAKLWGASPTGSVKKITKIRPAHHDQISS